MNATVNEHLDAGEVEDVRCVASKLDYLVRGFEKLHADRAAGVTECLDEIPLRTREYLVYPSAGLMAARSVLLVCSAPLNDEQNCV